MAVEYDLVILGATPAARTAAITAAQTHARVAWVCKASPAIDPLTRLRESIYGLAAQGQPISQSDWCQWSHLLQMAADSRMLPSEVQAYGVDYVDNREGAEAAGAIAFKEDGLWIAQQRLRSRAYLLAMDPQWALPARPDLAHPRVWSVARLEQELRLMDRVWPLSVAVWGNSPSAVEISQSLRRLGRSVRLLTGGHSLLPQEDAEMAFLLQAYLEGDRIAVDNQGDLTHLESAPSGSLALTVGDLQYDASVLVWTESVATGHLPPWLPPLNLLQTRSGLAVTPALQTSRSGFYACGALLGGYPLPSLAQQEAQIAVHNALFEQQRSVLYHQIPYVIHSQPPLARVGLTEAQARRYDPQVRVLRHTYKDCDRTLFEQTPAGLCKILVQPNGTLLGAHLLGTSAGELIHLLALALQQGIRLQDLRCLGVATPTFTEVLQQIADQWYHQQHQRDRNERWFYNRRRQTLDFL